MLTVFKILKFIFRHLVPERIHYPLVRWGARVVCFSNARLRNVIIANLLPIVGPKKAPALAPELLGNFFMTEVDFICPRRSLAAEMVVENEAVVQETFKRGEKIIFVTAHMGFWELGMSYLAWKGYPAMGMYAVYRDKEMVRWIHTHRDPEVEWVPGERGAAEACLKALERGRCVGLVADIPFGEKGRRVLIAGTPTRLALGPWVIALRAGATVIPSFILRRAPGSYRIIFHEPLRPPAGSFRFKIETMQDSYRALLERTLMAHPEQWGVLQPFWDREPSC